MQRLISLSVFSCCFSYFATAQNLRDTSRILNTVNISAAPITQFALGHNTITFDEVMLKNYQFQTLDNVLTEQSSAAVRNYGSSLSTLSLRGSSSSHTAILWNGINIQNSLSGTPDFTLYNASAFNNVSVQLGGESALYGSGAMGGTIILQSDVSKHEGFHANFGAQYGNWNTTKLNAGFSFNKNNFRLQLNNGYQNATNNFAFRNTAAYGAPIENISNAAYSGGYTIGTINYDLSRDAKFCISAWIQNNSREIAPTMLAATDSAKQNDASMRVVASFQKMTDTLLNHSINFRVAYLDDDLQYNSLGVHDSKNRGTSYVAEFENNTSLLKNMSLRWGLNYTQNNSLSNNLVASAERKRIAIFVAQKFIARKTTWSINVREENVDGNLTPFTSSLQFEQTLHNSEKNLLQWRGAAARSFNLPALNDLYWQQLGNPNLLPEQGFSIETGLNYTQKIIAPFNFKATVYAHTIKNQIVWLPQLDGNWRPNNIASVNAVGLELQAEKKIVLNAATEINLKTQYTFTHATTDEGYQVIYVPQHTATAQFKFQIHKSAMTINSNFASRRFSTRDNSTWAEKYVVANAHFSHTFNFSKSTFEVSLRAQNIFNTDYQVVAYYPMPRRTLSVAAQIFF